MQLRKMYCSLEGDNGQIPKVKHRREDKGGGKEASK